MNSLTYPVVRVLESVRERGKSKLHLVEWPLRCGIARGWEAVVF